MASTPHDHALPNSVRTTGDTTLWAEHARDGVRIHALAADARALEAFEGERTASSHGLHLSAPATPRNAAALRALLPNLQPVPLGQRTSAGFGDRLGVATPGHVDALRAVQHANTSDANSSIAPIFAQQSVRENSRTGRTPQEVMDDATIGAFAAGWTGIVGADADHQKTPADIDAHVRAGFSFFTIDPGDSVHSDADTLSGHALESAFNSRVPWDALETTASDFRNRYQDHTLDLGDRALTLSDEAVVRAAVKYGAALAHVKTMARHLRAQASAQQAEIEVSVDETATPTTLIEHAVLALELRRLGVDWVSLAPRFVGAFEKGVDYMGDLGALSLDLAGHARIARALGGYKLSLHSGSDKFSVYPIAMAATGGLVHLKTAGTSYLEALRVVGAFEPDVLHEVVKLGLERFDADVKSYHISGHPSRMPNLAALPGRAAVALLDQLDARQVLHVTFGSALKAHGASITRVLQANPQAYRDALRRHFERHLAPFAIHIGGRA